MDVRSMLIPGKLSQNPRSARDQGQSGRFSERTWAIISGTVVAVIGLFLGAVFTPLGTEIGDMVARITGAGGDELEITAQPVLNPCDQAWGVTKSQGYQPPDGGTPESRKLMEGDDAMREWIKKHDAASLDELSLNIIVAGSSARVATLLDVRVKVLAKAPARPMEPLAVPCGGPGFFHWFHIPLDLLPVGRAVSVSEIYDRWPATAVPPSPDPNKEPIAAEQAESVRPLSLPLEVSAADSESLRVVAEAKDCDCRWEIQLVWGVAGQDVRTATVDMDGRPFRTVGTGA
jgi:hypothetical protein